MELNNGQQECLKKLLKWWKEDKKTQQVFEISGAAGTGKTTIVKSLIEELNLDTDEVMFMAFVGKAAMALSRTGLNAKTIHSSIYYRADVPKLNEKGEVVTYMGRIVTKPVFRKKSRLNDNIKLIVVDEAPMVNRQIGMDILSFGIPVIALGDLNQLPPIFGDYFFLKNPDHILTEIMRQKKDNPIIYLSHEIIKGNFPKPGVYGNNVLVTKKSYIDDEWYNRTDINICGKNKTREKINDIVRHKLIGIKRPEPVIGDKIICRQNVWDRCIYDNIYLINGMIGYITDIDVEGFNKTFMWINFRPEFIEDSFDNIPLDYKFLFLSQKEKESYIAKGIKFEYGYAITCHLAQGSQYKKVLIHNEFLGDRNFYKKWLYTAITRAQEKAILLL